MIYALIKDGIVKNMIVADADFISKISSEWDYCVRVDLLDTRPSIGWSYDGANFNE